MSHLTRVGVLRGGPSNEYEVSLNSGASVLKALRDHFDGRYHPKDIFIDRSRTWHVDGVAARPEQVLPKIDVAVNALHGAYGEDGTVQSFLEAHGMPYTGSNSLSSALAMNKVLTKKIFKDNGIKTPYGREIRSEDIRSSVADPSFSRELFESIILPAVVKPSTSGSSVGVAIVKRYDDLIPALSAAAEHSDSVMIEEFIPGIEATCGVMENFRDHRVYTLPPIEIRPKTQFFDYQAKYAGQSEEIVPATFADKTKREIESLARKIHETLGLRHYSRSDFIIHPRRGVYALEANTLPGLTAESLMPKALRAVGSDVHEFVGHIIGLALA